MRRPQAAAAYRGEARRRGYSIILFNSDYNPRNEQEYLDVVRRYRVDGVLAAPIRETSAEWKEELSIQTGACKALDKVIQV